MAAGEGEHGEPLYLTFEDALEIFAAILGGTVAQAADQLRSRDASQGRSAAHGPTRTTRMLTFLELNGFGLSATDREFADWIIGFSRGVTPRETAELIRSRPTPAN